MSNINNLLIYIFITFIITFLSCISATILYEYLKLRKARNCLIDYLPYDLANNLVNIANTYKNCSMKIIDYSNILIESLYLPKIRKSFITILCSHFDLLARLNLKYENSVSCLFNLLEDYNTVDFIINVFHKTIKFGNRNVYNIENIYKEYMKSLLEAGNNTLRLITTVGLVNFIKDKKFKKFIKKNKKDSFHFILYTSILDSKELNNLINNNNIFIVCYKDDINIKEKRKRVIEFGKYYEGIRK